MEYIFHLSMSHGCSVFALKSKEHRIQQWKHSEPPKPTWEIIYGKQFLLALEWSRNKKRMLKEMNAWPFYQRKSKQTAAVKTFVTKWNVRQMEMHWNPKWKKMLKRGAIFFERSNEFEIQSHCSFVWCGFHRRPCFLHNQNNRNFAYSFCSPSMSLSLCHTYTHIQAVSLITAQIYCRRTLKIIYFFALFSLFFNQEKATTEVMCLTWFASALTIDKWRSGSSSDGHNIWRGRARISH